MFRPNLDMFIDVCGLADPNKNESCHKTDSCYLVFDFCQEGYRAI